MASKNNNIDLMNKSELFVSKKDKHIFDNIYLIAGIMIIALCFVGYAIYYYLTKNNILDILSNSSYYGSDIANYQPLFQNTVKNINDCINDCNSDITCDGITYNSNTQECLGTKNGQIRNENSNYSAWVKPPNKKIETLNKDFTKAVIVGYTKTMTVVDGKKIQNPYLLGNFAYSFNLSIYDFYKNYGSWRHIFHKGTPINTGTILNYQSWENLIIDYPNQSIGVWLAPFTNNLRVAVTTTSLADTSYGSYPDAFVQKCDNMSNNCYITDTPNGKWTDTSRSGDGSNPKTRLSTYIEFFEHDIQNIPLNKQVNITLNFRGRDAEVYYDGKIVKIIRLDGIPSINKESLYVMNDTTFGGEINNLIYHPEAVLLGDIQSIMSLSPMIQTIPVFN